MKGADVAIITLSIGIAGYGVSGVASALFHKWTKRNSFVVIEVDRKIIIKNGPVNNWLNSISLFFLLSVSSFMVAANASGIGIYLQLLLIYTVCLVFAVVSFLQKKKFEAIIDRETNTVAIKGKQYHFNNTSDFEVSDRNSWISDDLDSYGFFIKITRNRRKLIYGYSVLWDMEALEKKVKEKLGAE